MSNQLELSTFAENQLVESDLQGFFMRGIGLIGTENLAERVNQSKVNQLALAYQQYSNSEQSSTEKENKAYEYLQLNAISISGQFVELTNLTRHTQLRPDDILETCTQTAHKWLGIYSPNDARYLISDFRRGFVRDTAHSLMNATPGDHNYDVTQKYLDLRRFIDSSLPLSGTKYDIPADEMSDQDILTFGRIISNLMNRSEGSKYFNKNLAHIMDSPSEIARILSHFEPKIVALSDEDQETNRHRDEVFESVYRSGLSEGLNIALINTAHALQNKDHIFPRHELATRLWFGIGGRGYDSLRILSEKARMTSVLDEWSNYFPNLDVKDDQGVETAMLLLQYPPPSQTVLTPDKLGEIDHFIMRFCSKNSRVSRDNVTKLFIHLRKIPEIIEALGSTEDEMRAQEQALIGRIRAEDYSPLSQAEILLLTLGEGIFLTELSLTSIASLLGFDSHQNAKQTIDTTLGRLCKHPRFILDPISQPQPSQRQPPSENRIKPSELHHDVKTLTELKQKLFEKFMERQKRITA